MTSLIEAGLRIDFLDEFPFTIEQVFPFIEQDAQGYWRLTEHGGSVPLLFSLKAVKPLPTS